MSDGNEVDIPITGPNLEKASAVALDHLGDGRVTETEIEDEESYHEVEVTLSVCSQVDVQLDEGFNVVGSEQDGTGSDDSTAGTPRIPQVGAGPLEVGLLSCLQRQDSSLLTPRTCLARSRTSRKACDRVVPQKTP